MSDPMIHAAGATRRQSRRDKEAVIRGLAAVVADAGRTTEADGLTEDALAREATSATGLPGGIAIPHCRTSGVDVPTLAFARLSPGVDFGAKDGPADLAFLIAAPAGGGRRPPRRPDPARPGAGEAGLHQRPARGRRSPQDVVDIVDSRRSSPPRHAKPGTRARGRAHLPRPPRPPRPPPRRPGRKRPWWPSPPARPASRTPTWPPRPWRPRPSGPASTCTSRPRARPAPPRSPRDVIAAADAVIFAVDVGRAGPGPLRRQAGGGSPA